MTFVDRILTIIITATLTSAVWIVAGGSLMELASSRESDQQAELAAAANAASKDEDEAGLLPEQILERAAELENVATVAAPEPGETTLMIPVKNVRPSVLEDTFFDQRDGAARLHQALDIEAPIGTAVVAAAPGTIEKMFVSKIGGKTIYVRSTDRRTIHLYSHLGSYAEGLKEGQRIRRGQRLGEVGVSSMSDNQAPHLHFAMLRTTSDAAWWEPANAVNPHPLLTSNLAN